MRTAFSIKKLGGVFSRANNLKTEQELKDRIAKADSILQITSNENWPVFRNLIDEFREEAIKGLSTRNITVEHTQRFTHRMELTKDIFDKINLSISSGREARGKLDKIMEKKQNA